VLSPKVTTNPQELLNSMWSCVQAAGPVFTENARCLPNGDSYECSLQLAPGNLTERVQKTLTSLMRAYAKESGWKVERLSIKKGYLALAISPSKAESNLSKKR
jgi:hypothetical protein